MRPPNVAALTLRRGVLSDNANKNKNHHHNHHNHNPTRNPNRGDKNNSNLHSNSIHHPDQIPPSNLSTTSSIAHSAHNIKITTTHYDIDIDTGTAADADNTRPSARRNPPAHDPNPSRSLSIRPALKSCDNNAIMRAPKQGAPTKPGNATMPINDKTTNRPLMPTLSANAKPSSRAPLTPRVAARSAATVRPGAHLEAHVAPIGGGLSDDSSYLNNVTPRSGSRRSRVDSAGTTPNGTPTPVSPRSSTFGSRRVSQDPSSRGGGLNISGVHSEASKRSTVHFGPALDRNQDQFADSKFFHASEAKSTNQPSRQQRPQLQNKAPTFYYASGESIPPISKTSPSVAGSAVGSTIGEERSQPRFFHANGTPDLHPSSTHHFPPPGSPASSSLNSPRLAAPISSGTISPQNRPTSPQRLSRKSSASSILSLNALPSPGLQRPTGLQSRTQSSHAIPSSRRVSVEATARSLGHSRTISAGSFDSANSNSKRQSSLSTIEAAPLSSPSEPDAAFAMSLSEEMEPIDDPVSAEEEVDGILKAGGSIEKMNELAANARRERKVLDLEITNSSLEAINRTLEREMRKQSAELRRFRRLSRSGRLSIATPNSHATSADGSRLSSMSEEEDEDAEEEEEEAEDLEDLEELEGTPDPQALAESDARHRKKDEKRLQKELSKHQQLLLDSQKMNQSLKRCLGWTEELITEAKKALEYRVHVDEVNLGGRVLAPDEIEEKLKREAEEDFAAEGLSDIGASFLRQARANAAANAALNVGEEGSVTGTDDRDSGVDLEAERFVFGEDIDRDSIGMAV